MYLIYQHFIIITSNLNTFLLLIFFSLFTLFQYIVYSLEKQKICIARQIKVLNKKNVKVRH